VQFAQKLLSTRGGTVAVAAVGALLAAAVFVAYLHRYRSSVNESTAPMTVLVAKDFIEEGTPGNVVGSEGLFQTASTPKDDLKEGAISDPDALRGLVAKNDIYPGQQLTVADFSPTAADALTNEIAGAERAISMALDSAHGMIGNVSAGDRVDVYGAFNVRPLRPDGTVDPDAVERPVLKLLVEDVLVLDSPEGGQAGFGASAQQTSDVTVRVTHEQAAKLAFSSENGKVWIVLRPNTGAQPTPPDLVTLETVLFGLEPVAAVRSFGGRQ
jgi:Flp pilus assembly protein CpaB